VALAGAGYLVARMVAGGPEGCLLDAEVLVDGADAGIAAGRRGRDDGTTRVGRASKAAKRAGAGTTIRTVIISHISIDLPCAPT
jgi:hypothetical protein